MKHMGCLQALVSRQSDALDFFTEHVTNLTYSLKEVTVTKQEMRNKEKIKQLEIACRRRIP